MFYLYITSVGHMERLSRVTAAILDVLEVLIASSGVGCHGFAIAKDVKRPTGSVYPILARLERAGWLESYWESEQSDHGRPRRRLYSLTPDGLLAARDLLAERRRGNAGLSLRSKLSLRAAGGAA
jgi:PadR family transcriptional regulator, regulatory protein PadR